MFERVRWGAVAPLRDEQWVAPAAVFLAGQYGVLFILSRGSPFGPPIAAYSITAAILSLLAGAPFFLLRLWRLWRAGEEHPIALLDWRAGVSYLVGFQLVALQIAALTWAKTLIPYVTPYWADNALADFERTILGKDAWRFIPTAFVRPLDTFYPIWAIVKFATLFTVLSVPPSALKVRAMRTYFLVVGALGTLGVFILPSVGPILFDQAHGGHRFAELEITLRAHAPIASSAMSYLESGHIFGGGVSAMPSMHVATAAWAAIVISARFPRLKLIAFSFWITILAGSLALGWHYLSDGLVGTAGALLIWNVLLARREDDDRRRES